MNLRQHQEIIVKWIVSCTTFEQLDLLSEVILEFIVRRFKDADSFEMEAVKSELKEALDSQKMEIVKSNHIPQQQ